MNRIGGWIIVGTAFGLVCTKWCDAAEPLADLLACRDIAQAAARLACFDREAALLAPASQTAGSTHAATTAATPEPAQPPPAAAVKLTPAAAPLVAATTPPPQPALDSQQQFGLSERAVAEREIAAGTRPSGISRIEAHIVRAAHASDGHLIFTLDNDQVWRQLETEEILIKPGEAVTISRAMLGSYWLKMSSGRGCKVTRLR
ncbi:MAG TPA: hypothetical protein VIH50_07580 [Steroidobacteraceae bacterium]